MSRIIDAMDRYLASTRIENERVEDFDPLEGIVGLTKEEFLEFFDVIVSTGFEGNKPGVLTESDLVTMIALALGTGAQLKQEPTAPTDWERVRDAVYDLVLPEVNGGRDSDERIAELVANAVADAGYRVAPASPDAGCPSSCDADCDAPCHEGHQVTAKQQHDPDVCAGREAQP